VLRRLALRLLAVPGHEAVVVAFQVGGALFGDEISVDVGVADRHFEALFEGAAGYDLAVFHVGVFGERNPIGQGPGVALARDGAELVGGGEAFFVGGDDGDEQFSGEFVPEMVEKIFQCAADAAVVIRCAEKKDVGLFYAFLERAKFLRVMGCIGIEERQGLGLEVQHIDRAAVGAHFFGDVMDDDAGDGLAIQTAGDSENVQGRFRHEVRIVHGRELSNVQRVGRTCFVSETSNIQHSARFAPCSPSTASPPLRGGEGDGRLPNVRRLFKKMELSYGAFRSMNWDTLCVSCASDCWPGKQSADALKLTTAKPVEHVFFDSIVA